MSLFCLVFMTDRTRSNRSWQLYFAFGVDHMYKIDHINVLFGFVTNRTLSDRSQKFSIVFGIDKTYMIGITNRTRSDCSWQLCFVFGVDRIYTISHVIVLSDFHHSQHLVRSIAKIKFWFWHRPLLYDQSHSFPIWFSSQLTPIQLVTTC